MTSRKLVFLGAGLVAVAAIAGAAVLALTVFGDPDEPPPPPTAAELVASLLAAPPGPEQAETARVLAARLDPGAVRQVGASGNANAVALVRKRLIAISSGATQNPRRRTRAVACLEELDDRASANGVATALLEDPQPGVRQAAGAALARMESAPLVVKRLVLARAARRSPAVQEVDRVLVAIGGPAVAPMLPLIDSESWTLDVIAGIGRPAVPPLRRQLNRGTFTQQVAASYGLLAIRKTEPQAVRSAVRTIVTLMMRRLANMQQAFEASRVLAHVGRPAFDLLLPLARKRSEELVGIEKQQGPFSAQALAMLAIVNPKAAGPLFAALRNRDYELIADLHQVYIQLGRPGSEPALIGALDAHGDPIMALAFLYSGNRKLDDGARRWAARNGYTITGEPGTSIPGSWGNANSIPLG